MLYAIKLGTAQEGEAMTSFFRAGTVAVGALLAVSVSAAEAAKPANMDAGRASLMQALSDCRKVADDTARLACFDKSAGALDQAESQGQVVVIDQQQAREVRRQAFGFKLPSINLFSRGAARSEEGVDHIDLQIESAHQNSEGKWVFVAANGAVWRQTDHEDFAVDPHKGAKLRVKNGLLGSFFCTVDNQPQVRCERVS